MTDFSIIIPTRNRARALLAALNSIGSAVSRECSLEIVVVDNGSTDKTFESFSLAKDKHPGFEWRYFYDAMPGLLTGRHRGAQEARGEILCYLDDDVLLEATWMDALAEAFKNSDAALVGGPSRPLYEIPPPHWLKDLWMDINGARILTPLSLIEQGDAIRAVDPCSILGLNFAVRKQILEKCGGFHPDALPKALQRYQGDGETGLSLKVSANGFCAFYHPKMALKHVIPGSRLTPMAFEERAFFQGICDSYTAIRRERKVSDEEVTWKDYLRPVKWAIEREFITSEPTADGVRRLMYRARLKGLKYHRNEVRRDPSLLAWVLKPDYRDYALPEGWQVYA